MCSVGTIYVNANALLNELSNAERKKQLIMNKFPDVKDLSVRVMLKVQQNKRATIKT